MAQIVKNCLQLRRHRFDTCVRKIPWRRGSSFLAWTIPWTEEPSGLQSMKSQRVRHNWTTNTSTFFTLMSSSNTSLNLEVVGPLMPLINHWSPGIEDFLDIHLITLQEISGKLSWVQHHTCRTNQRHKETLKLLFVYFSWEKSKLVHHQFHYRVNIQLPHLLLM